MNINALIAFRAIVTEGSAGAAARRLHRSQSAISRLIAQLEHDVKLRLFHRTRRRLVLTEDGSAFYKETERILNGLNEIPQIAEDIRARRRSGLRLVVMPRAVAAWVAPAAAEFRTLHPELRLTIDVLRRHDMENWLAGRHYDLGIGALPVHHAAIDSVALFRAPVSAVVARKHPLATRKRIAPADLGSHAIIGFSPGLLPREQMDHIFHAAGFAPDFSLETSSTYLACMLAAHGIGVAIVDTVSAAVTDGRTVCIPLEPREWVTFGLLTPKHVTQEPAVALFAAQLRAVAARLVASHGVDLI